MKTPLTLSRVRYTFFAAAARRPASPETAQYPVMEPPRPRTSPTQNHAYTSAVKSAPTPICARESSRKREGEGRRFRRHPSVDFGRSASRESRAREDGRRARDREGKTRGGLRAHLGHRQVHATLPLRLQHLNLPPAPPRASWEACACEYDGNRARSVSRIDRTRARERRATSRRGSEDLSRARNDARSSRADPSRACPPSRREDPPRRAIASRAGGEEDQTKRPAARAGEAGRGTRLARLLNTSCLPSLSTAAGSFTTYSAFFAIVAL